MPTPLSSIASARGALASAFAILTLPLLRGNLAEQMEMRFAFLVVPVLINLAAILQIVFTKHLNTGKIAQMEIEDL